MIDWTKAVISALAHLMASKPSRMRRTTMVLCAISALILFLAVPAPARADTRSLSGQFLVAEPDMRDSRFARTVILVISHDAGGALGVIVNRPVGTVDVVDLLASPGQHSQGAGDPIGIHYGGPMEPKQGRVLHSSDRMPPGSRPVGTDFAVAEGDDVLRSIVRGEGPEYGLFILGYAGWRPGQLETELRRGYWFVAPAERDLVFTDTPDATWQTVMERRGDDI